MIKLSDVKIPVEADEGELLRRVKRAAGTDDISDFTVLKQSVDARDKGNLLYVYTVAFSMKDESKYVKGNVTKDFVLPKSSIKSLTDGLKYEGKRPIVVGFGPAGMFCALTLAYSGAKPIVLERGSDAVTRQKKVDLFLTDGILDEDSNVQFGEGGAGTFSDGKLNTLIGGEYISVVLNEFVKSGAPQEITYQNKPHIGTDKLISVVQNVRNRIIALGGEVRFNAKVTDFIIDGGKLAGVKVGEETIDGDKVFVAIGHSARDTVERLYAKGIKIEPKVFSMGVRIEHRQRDVSESQYGKKYALLQPADYKAAVKLSDGRSLYTFCMCPGGKVINASSEESGVCVNGMSNYLRDGTNANSAILVNVTPNEYGEGPLDGIAFQRKYERAAYGISGRYLPPIQTYGDFLNGKSGGIGSIKPSVGKYVHADLHVCLPDFVARGIAEGVGLMARRMRFFNDKNAVLTGVETRSSSPVRLMRDEKYRSNIEGVYPLGEGAGYSGGITSSAVDGIKGALAVLE